MISPRSQLLAWIEQGVIPQHKIDEALRLANVTPNGASWLVFLDRLLLWLGGLGVAAAGLFFIAYNWVDLDRFSKFGLVELLMILAIVFYWRADEHSVAAKVSLLVASVFFGVLLALFGQTYQTGADPWQLFFFWAVLITPWAIIGRFPALWIVWLALLNIALALYCSTFRGTLVQFDTDMEQLWLAFACNSLALAAWEYGATTHRWMAQAWASRLIACASGIPITILISYSLMEFRQTSLFSGPAWIAWLAIMFVVYRRIKPDLFMLAGCCLSIIAVVFSFAIKMMIDHSMLEGLLLLALATVAMGAGAGLWLKKIHREMQS